MAKRDQDSPADKGKMRVLFVEVEGSNASLQDAIKSMVSAINRPVQVISTQRIAPSNSGALAVPVDAGDGTEEVVDAVDDSPESNDPQPPNRQKRGEGKKVDRNAGIELVTDINFMPDDEQSLKEFFAEKSPKTDMEKILVLVYYMQETLKLDAICPGHILTAFKNLDRVRVPVDLKQTIRNMKTEKVWLKFTDMDAIRVATAGENLVQHDLPAKNT